MYSAADRGNAGGKKMNVTMLKSKIHRAVVKQAELDYVGSITIDSKLMEEAGILEYEKVQVVDVENGNRLETYTIAGEPGSGMICLNAAAAPRHLLLYRQRRYTDGTPPRIHLP